MKFRTFPACLSAIALGTAFLSFSCNRSHDSSQPSAPTDNGELPVAMPISQCNNPAAKIRLTSNQCGYTDLDLQLSCQLFNDIEISETNFNQNQRRADLFSWQEFISLNWPVVSGQRGVPDVTQKINAPGARVWETWKEEYEVFLPNGRPPAAWNAPEPIPPTCTGITKHLFRTQKIDDVVDESLQAAGETAAFPPTLTDQKGKLVRYEIRMNKVMFDYIDQNRLYDANVQKSFPKVDFPDGGILVKASWREVTPDEAAQYHTVTACVCDRDAAGQPINCQTRQMGLVGLHITQKTANAPQLIWSTFEQINNVPVKGVNGHPAFYNPLCSAKACPPNKQTAAGKPNQVTRVKDIPNVIPNCLDPYAAQDNVALLNRDVANAMKTANSVFQYYELVNTQWPRPPVNKETTTVFQPQPAVLGNTTMETFVQETSSCMGCHAMARTVNPNPTSVVSSDFTFTLNNARPAQPNPNVLPPPGATPAPSWSTSNWDKVKSGYRYATQTYESLPKNVPISKLHCSSCHLNAGGNMTAAWWVNLNQPGKYPTLPELQHRINGCFQNSMNGYALCTPQGYTTPFNAPPCKPGDEMDAFTTYMDWLTAVWNNPNTPTHGFPPLPSPTPSGTPDLGQGKMVFEQKCAVCHQLDGQGRYPGNLYYRPALWGKHSFNQNAGMFSNHSDLTAFVRWNMPLGSGGLLTNTEAFNVAGYVDAQTHPTPIPTPISLTQTRR